GVAAPVRKNCEASEAAQTGWWFSFKNIFPFDLEPPPRPLHQRKLRDISLDVASTPEARRGDGAVRQVCRKHFNAVSIQPSCAVPLPSFGVRRWGRWQRSPRLRKSA